MQAEIAWEHYKKKRFFMSRARLSFAGNGIASARRFHWQGRGLLLFEICAAL